MSIFDSNTNVEKWRYTVRQIGIRLPNLPMTVIPNIRLSNMYIEENFETHYFPLFKIKLILESELYYTIIRNKNECQIYLRVDKYYYLQNQTEKSNYKPYINGMFDIIVDDDREDFEIMDKKKEDKSYTSIVESDLNDPEKIDMELELYLFSPVVKNTKININKIFDKATVLDAIQYIMTESKVNNLLMAQPDNDTIYDSLIIPPLSLVKALSFIETYYGIYKKGTMIWFGLNNSYIVPYESECKAWKKNEKRVTNIIMNGTGNTSHSVVLGKIHNQKQNFIVADPYTVSIESASISNDFINANELKTIDSYDGEINIEESDATTIDKNFAKFYENKTLNKYASSIYASKTSALSTVINVRLCDFDLDDFTPNKQYRVIFEYVDYRKKYHGGYILSKISSMCSREGEDFVVDSVLALKKTD